MNYKTIYRENDEILIKALQQQIQAGQPTAQFTIVFHKKQGICMHVYGSWFDGHYTNNDTKLVYGVVHSEDTAVGRKLFHSNNTSKGQ